jgi:hypothetical protein
MTDKIKLQVKDLKALMEWVKEVGVESTATVEITVSHSSGIGPSIEVSIETQEGQGVWKNLTDYRSW